MSRARHSFIYRSGEISVTACRKKVAQKESDVKNPMDNSNIYACFRLCFCIATSREIPYSSSNHLPPLLYCAWSFMFASFRNRWKAFFIFLSTAFRRNSDMRSKNNIFSLELTTILSLSQRVCTSLLSCSVLLLLNAEHLKSVISSTPKLFRKHVSRYSDAPSNGAFLRLFSLSLGKRGWSSSITSRKKPMPFERRYAVRLVDSDSALAKLV